MKTDTQESLARLAALLSAIRKSPEWSKKEKSTRRAAQKILAAIIEARKLMRALGHTIGRKTAMQIVMLLNQIDKEFAYLKLELEFLSQSEVASETLQRVDKHAEWKIDAIEEQFAEKLRQHEKTILAVAKAEKERAENPPKPAVPANGTKP